MSNTEEKLLLLLPYLPVEKFFPILEYKSFFVVAGEGKLTFNGEVRGSPEKDFRPEELAGKGIYPGTAIICRELHARCEKKNKTSTHQHLYWHFRASHGQDWARQRFHHHFD